LEEKRAHFDIDLRKSQSSSSQTADCPLLLKRARFVVVDARKECGARCASHAAAFTLVGAAAPRAFFSGWYCTAARERSPDPRIYTSKFA
jgi:hypothetical protein